VVPGGLPAARVERARSAVDRRPGAVEHRAADHRSGGLAGGGATLKSSSRLSSPPIRRQPPRFPKVK